MKPNSSLTLKSNRNRPGGSLEVIQITDLHLLSDPENRLLGVKTDESARQVIELARTGKWPPDLVVLSGDLAQEAYVETYRRLDEILKPLGVPCVCIPGNHDDLAQMHSELKSDNVYCISQILGESWQFICLNSSRPDSPSGYFSTEALQILESHLDEYPEKFALVFLHHHPLPIGSTWLDTMVVDQSQKFFAILGTRSQCRAVAFGHIHQALDMAHENLRLFGTPSTCFQFKPGSEDFLLDDQPPGYRHFSLYPDGKIQTGVFRLPQLPQGLNLSSSGYLS